MSRKQHLAWDELSDLHAVRVACQLMERRWKVGVAFLGPGGAPAAIGPRTDSVLSLRQLVQQIRAYSGTAPDARLGRPQQVLAPGERSAVLSRGGLKEVVAPVVVDTQCLGWVSAGAFLGGNQGEAAPSHETLRELGLPEPMLAEAIAELPALSPIEVSFLRDLLETLAEEIVVFQTQVAATERRLDELEEPVATRFNYSELIGTSKPIVTLFRLLDKVVAADSTVLITGENGTGKELIARAIHFNSTRKNRPFVVQNCSAFNDNLLDSELFGHKKGAFTGAVVDKRGLFEVADGGTFFLDEIGDMTPALQVKLLRVLQEGTFLPVGDTQVKHVDVRIIAATNRDLKGMMERGEFREDLYYRINVINITPPPLRERRSDIPVLVEHFLRKHAKGDRHRQKKLTRGCLEQLVAHRWPGNVRELENEIERMVVLAGDEKLIGEDLLSTRILQVVPLDDGTADGGTLPDAVKNLERNLIYEVLKRNHWNKTRAAEELQISRRNLIRKVQKYKLEQRRAS
ncbi:MAG: sigma 54-interacting transcriptional regulator [Deltaproteobacteria bacterium]|nr:sigma 54-interacting transcriptional regulator [Deltaproteobacteria bacterium]